MSPQQPSTAEILLTRTIDGMRTEWANLVLLVEKAVCVRVAPRNAIVPEQDTTQKLAQFLSKQTGIGVDSIQRKLDAIVYHFQNLSLSAEEIIKLGQEHTVSTYIKSKKAEKYTEQVQLRFTIPGSQREIVMQEIERIKRILGCVSSETVWDFYLSLTRGLNDDEVKHLAGEFIRKQV